MPSSADIPNIQKLGIIAGSGVLPYDVCLACEARGVEVFVVGVHDDADKRLMDGREYVASSMGQAGQIVKAFQKRGITDLVMIGRVQRPSLSDLKPDLKTTKFFARIAMKAMGDDGLLSAVRGELERDGFTIYGAHCLAPNLVMPSGVIGKHKPTKEDATTIEYGVQASQAIGRMDIGQSAIVQQGMVLGLEGVEGTDVLMQRCADLQRKKGRGAIVVKTAKPNQDLDMDMPTIGLNTVQKARDYGYVGVAVEAGKTLMADREALVSFADKHKIFVIGIDI
jgi:DUF1009 family protein